MQPGPHKMVEVASARLAAGAPRLPAHAVGSGAFHSPRQPRGPRLLELALGLAGKFLRCGPPSRQPSHDSGEPRWCVNREGVRKEEL